jgi:hypothetical protein
MVSGKLTPLPVLLHGRLISFHKAVEGGICPVVMLEIWAQLAALCTIAASDNLGPTLKPLQLGVGVPEGSEAMGHAVHSALDAEADSVVVQADFANAFNSISCAALVAAVSQRQPQRLPLVMRLYGQHSNLWVVGAHRPLPNTPPVRSPKDGRQVDPLGPLLFALTIQSAPERADAVHANANVLALNDGVCLVGAASGVRSAFHELS